MAATQDKKIVTLDLLAKFKEKMDASVDKKITDSGITGGGTTNPGDDYEYATEDDINAMFTDPEEGSEPSEE